MSPREASAALVLRSARINRSQVDGWLWQARHAIRQRNTRRACEAMLSALWLLGVEHG